MPATRLRQRWSRQVSPYTAIRETWHADTGAHLLLSAIVSHRPTPVPPCKALLLCSFLTSVSPSTAPSDSHLASVSRCLIYPCLSCGFGSPPPPFFDSSCFAPPCFLSIHYHHTCLTLTLYALYPTLSSSAYIVDSLAQQAALYIDTQAGLSLKTDQPP